MSKTTQVGLDKRIDHINRLILDYSELREKEKSKTEKENYEKLISLLVNQKHRIQEFFSSLTQIS